MKKRKSQYNSGLGIVIDFYLNKNNMSPAQLARELNVSPAAVSKWINGKNLFKFKHLEKMLKIFKIDFIDFAKTVDKETNWGKFSLNYPH